MTQAPDIRFIGMDASGALAALARNHAEDLRRIHTGIMSCQVAIELERARRDACRQFRVCVGLVTAPGHRLTEVRGGSVDVYAALRDAFEASRRELEQSARTCH